MDIENDFLVYLITLDISTAIYEYEPFHFSHHADWKTLGSFGGYNHKLRPFSVEYEGRNYPSYIYPRNEDELIMITKIDLPTLRSLHYPDIEMGFDVKKMQPFFYYTYKDRFGDYESVFQNHYVHDWYEFRPVIIYIEPKTDNLFDERGMEEIREKLKPYIDYYEPIEEELLTLFVATPSVKQLDEQGSRVFIIKKSLQDYHKNKEDSFHNGFGMDWLVYRYLDFVADYNRLRLVEKKWNSFSFPDFSSMAAEKIKQNKFTYAERMHEQLHNCTRNFYLLLDETMALTEPARKRCNDCIPYFGIYTGKSEKEFDPNGFPAYVADNYRNAVNRAGQRIEPIRKRLDELTVYSDHFYARASTSTNIRLQRRVYFLSYIVITLTVLTILFASWNDSTILSKVIHWFADTRDKKVDTVPIDTMHTAVPANVDPAPSSKPPIKDSILK